MRRMEDNKVAENRIPLAESELMDVFWVPPRSLHSDSSHFGGSVGTEVPAAATLRRLPRLHVGMWPISQRLPQEAWKEQTPINLIFRRLRSGKNEQQVISTGKHCRSVCTTMRCSS
jgi:hypothetical protein